MIYAKDTIIIDKYGIDVLAYSVLGYLNAIKN
jgi:hypothetical protein